MQAFLLQAELWTIFHDELDLDGNGHLDAHELKSALAKAGKRTVVIILDIASLKTRVQESNCHPKHWTSLWPS